MLKAAAHRRSARLPPAMPASPSSDGLGACSLSNHLRASRFLVLRARHILFGILTLSSVSPAESSRGGDEAAAANRIVSLPYWSKARAIFNGHSVYVKVGVQNPERRSQSERWIEFDPTVTASVQMNRMILPFAATNTFVPSLPFFIHQLGGCSGTLRPAGWASNRTRYHLVSSAACKNQLAATPRSEWKLWDRHAETKVAASSASRACFSCQDPSQVKYNTTFPAVQLGLLLHLLGPSHIPFIDVDAQGTDVDLIKSFGKYPRLLDKIDAIRIECQDTTYWPAGATPPWLYEGGQEHPLRHPNACSEAIHFLQPHGFNVSAMEMNNCACAEFNLYMRRTMRPGLRLP